jgi:hypothetical protein
MTITLKEVLQNCWTMLVEGATNQDHPFHTPVLGTSNLGVGANSRMVILRQVEPAERILICHTDDRSNKLFDIGGDPRVSWLFYHPVEKIQLRVYGEATIHTDDSLADEQWETTDLFNRRHYCAVHAPSTSFPEPNTGLPDFLINRPPTLAESLAGRKYFAVIRCQIYFVDWLKLRFEGHHRARFFWQDNQLKATWTTP